MKALVVALALVLLACSKTPTPTPPAASPRPSPSPTPVTVTAGAYWDQHPADLHDLCTVLNFFAQSVGWPNELAYQSALESWEKRDYHPSDSDPAARDAFAEAVTRCGL